VGVLRSLIAKLGAAFHWQPSEIKRLGFNEALDYLNDAVDMGLLESV